MVLEFRSNQLHSWLAYSLGLPILGRDQDPPPPPPDGVTSGRAMHKRSFSGGANALLPQGAEGTEAPSLRESRVMATNCTIHSGLLVRFRAWSKLGCAPVVPSEFWCSYNTIHPSLDSASKGFDRSVTRKTDVQLLPHCTLIGGGGGGEKGEGKGGIT
jgi:hypothetical protein